MSCTNPAALNGTARERGDWKDELDCAGRGAHRVTGGAILARNVLYNLAASAVPMIAAIVAIPILLRDIGLDRFALLTLVWAFMGYFGTLDLGIGRAATKLITDSLAEHQPGRVPGLFWTSLYIMTACGVAFGLVTAIIAPWLVTHALKIPAGLRREALVTCYVMAGVAPFVAGTAAFRGLLASTQSFGVMNAVRVPLAILMFVSSLAVLPWTHNLAAVAGAICITRVAGWCVYFGACAMVRPELLKPRLPDPGLLTPLFSFGKWVMVSSVIDPLINYLDRFVIGTLCAIGALAWYTTPYEIASKLFILPAAVCSVLFPALAERLLVETSRCAGLYLRVLEYTLASLFLPVLLLVTFAPEALRLWLGVAFAAHATPVLRWLAIAVLANCAAAIPFTLIHAAHRPDLATKIHLVEGVVYAPILLWMAARWGVEGAAAAATIRSVLEMAAHFLVAQRLVPAVAGDPQRVGLMLLGCAVPILAAVALPESLPIKIVFAASNTGALLVVGWRRLLTHTQRDSIRATLGFAIEG